jgi:hypothetical protein
MTTISKEMEITTETKCPTCYESAKNEEITETCRLIYSNEIDAVNVCIHKTRFLAFRDAISSAEKNGTELNEDFLDDPCMGCKHNEVVHDEGTFLRVEELEPIDGRPRFGEVHKCSCGTTFLIAH